MEENHQLRDLQHVSSPRWCRPVAGGLGAAKGQITQFPQLAQHLYHGAWKTPWAPGVWRWISDMIKTRKLWCQVWWGTKKYYLYIYIKRVTIQKPRNRVLVIALNYVTYYVWKRFGEGSESLVVRCVYQKT